jgi:hypothetical protein
MNLFLFVSFLVVAAFALGVWLAPVIRNDYGEFKAYVEQKLKDAEQAAKDKARQALKL